MIITAKKVAIADQLLPDILAYWQQLAPEYNCEVSAPITDSADELNAVLKDADAVVVKSTVVDREFLDRCPNIRMVQKEGLYPEKIDLDEVKRRGLALATYSLPSSIAVAEQAMALMLACARKVVLGHQQTVAGAYRELGIEPFITSQRHHNFQWMKIPGLQELYGMNLGILGFGTIGQEIAVRAKAFGMNISYYKRTRLPEKMENDFGVTCVSKEEIFKNSDYIIVVVPLTEETEKIVGAKEFALMKPTAYFINVCRGGVVDEQALVEAVESRKIYGAALDVFVQEPVPYDHPVLTLENVTFSPHIGGGKGGGREREVRSVLGNIQNYFEGKPLKQEVKL